MRRVRGGLRCKPLMFFYIFVLCRLFGVALCLSPRHDQDTHPSERGMFGDVVDPHGLVNLSRGGRLGALSGHQANLGSGLCDGRSDFCHLYQCREGAGLRQSIVMIFFFRLDTQLREFSFRN